MSTSISLVDSTPNEDATTSESFPDSRVSIRNHSLPQDDGLIISQNTRGNQPDHGRHTDGQQIETKHGLLELAQAQLISRLNHIDQHPRTASDSRCDTLLAEEIYDQIDGGLSRDGLEDRERDQANYIEGWLNEIVPIENRASDVYQDLRDPIRGNVVGIRDFSPENSVAASHWCRDELDRLKCDYSKLKTANAKLRIELDEANQKFNRAIKKRGNELRMLKAMVGQHGEKLEDAFVATCDSCMIRFRDQQRSIQGLPPTSGQISVEQDAELRKLEFDLQSKQMDLDVAKKKLEMDNGTLKRDQEDREAELDNLRKQIRSLSLKTTNDQCLNLYNENIRLKDVNDMEMVEIQLLKDNYSKLEWQLKSLMEDRKSLMGEKDAELARIVTELCRLQREQPKLQMHLDTERMLILELKTRIESLQRDNKQLNELLDELKQDLHRERCRSDGSGSSELGTLHGEISRLQDKCYSLAKEKSDLEDKLRNSRTKVSSMDVKFQNEINQVRQDRKIELDQTNEIVRKLEIEHKSLTLKLDQMAHELEQSKVEKQQVSDELATVRDELQELAVQKQNDQQSLANLKQIEVHADSLRSQLQASEARNIQLVDELEHSRSQSERSKQQLSDLKTRYELLQKSLDEFKKQKDRELARLRVDLNYEQYNRQVALKRLERELRASLKELETMKCRFSTRLCTQSDSAADQTNQN